MQWQSDESYRVHAERTNMPPWRRGTIQLAPTKSNYHIIHWVILLSMFCEHWWHYWTSCSRASRCLVSLLPQCSNRRNDSNAIGLLCKSEAPISFKSWSQETLASTHQPTSLKWSNFHGATSIDVWLRLEKMSAILSQLRRRLKGVFVQQ